jgi:hypothetical protein
VIVGSCEPLWLKLIVTEIVSSGVGSCTTPIPSATDPFGVTDNEVLAIVSRGRTPTVDEPLSELPAASVNDATTLSRPPSSASDGV